MVEMTPKRSRGRPRNDFASADAGTVQSLDRAMQLLKIVAEADGLSLTEIARLGDLPASTAYRILTTLQRHGALEFAPVSQLWFVGIETFRMGSAFLRRNKLTEAARSVLQELMLATGETANLALAEPDCVVFVQQVESSEAIRAYFRQGTRSPYHASGIGKAVLAHMGAEARKLAMRQMRLEAFTPKTIRTTEQLLQELEAVRQRGHAIDDEERYLGMRCISAAVFNEAGAPVAGISVSGPTVRVLAERTEAIAMSVMRAAEQLTEAIGGHKPREGEHA
jgi:IclR family transcriptional regulator, acetate operon repressor